MLNLISSSRRRKLAGALLAVPALLLATPGTADAAPTRDRSDAAAGWLGRQLDARTGVMIGGFGPDYGLTADVVLALSSAKVGRRAAGMATRALSRNVLAYTGGGDEAEHYAGAWAKLLVVAAAQGRDPRAFGSGPRADLVAGLSALECGATHRPDCLAGDDGRFSDRSRFGDFSNTFSQSLAIIGLERTTRRGASADAVSYLLGRQNSDGGFPETFSPNPFLVASVDATGFAVQALVAVGTRRALAAAADAGRWLRRAQNANGSYSGTGARNANSTALAAQALTALGGARDDRAAAKARGFLRSLQVGCSGGAARRGMVRYDRAGTGDPARATSQAVPALAQATLTEISAEGSSRGLPRLGC